MQKIISFIFLAVLALNLHAAEAKWLTDFEAAKKQAATESKPILMDFTGSTWCPPCKALKKNVFSTPEFAEFASKNLVLVELDYPRNTSKASKALQALSDDFKVEAFPTIVILDKSGKELGRMEGYGGDPTSAYIKKLKDLMAKAK